MSDINTKCLDVFPKWLQSLGDDVRAIIAALQGGGLSDEGRRHLLGGVNYLFKSLDLIPDGIDDIGYLDDAFILRLAAKAALEGDADDAARAKLEPLAADTEVLGEFLDPQLYTRLDTYARNLKTGAARGRMVDEIVEDPEVFKTFTEEAEAWASEFQGPAFSRDEKNLIKLTAFFEAKLPK